MVLWPHPPLHDRLEEVDGNVELESEGEENGEGHHDLHQDCKATERERYNVIEEVLVTYNWSTGRFKVILPETVSPYLR